MQIQNVALILLVLDYFLPHNSYANADAEIIREHKLQSETNNLQIIYKTTAGTGELRKVEIASGQTLVKLNVGGKHFETALNTLTRINNTYFTELFSNPSEIQIDDKGRIFIDRNQDLFSHILDYLRTDKIVLPEDRHTLLLLIAEAKFYRLTDLLVILMEPERKREDQDNLRNQLFSYGTLLNVSQQIKLNEFYGINDQKWILLYKASKNGFRSFAFHTLCDNRGPTMTIIKSSKEYLFGGFTTASWAQPGSGCYKTDPSAFIFTIINPHGTPPTKFTNKSKMGEAAVCCHSDHGPIFGVGHDIFIAENGNIKWDSNTNFPTTYADTTGKGITLFTGALHFGTNDIEVYGLA